jgi:hypothetical protein
MSHKKGVPSVMRQNQCQNQYALGPVSRSALGTESCPDFSPDCICMLYSRHFRFYLHFGSPLRDDDVLIGAKHAARDSGSDLCFLKASP